MVSLQGNDILHCSVILMRLKLLDMLLLLYLLMMLCISQYVIYYTMTYLLSDLHISALNCVELQESS